MKSKTIFSCPRYLILPAALLTFSGFSLAQDACPNRGQLDNAYCDANNDLVADLPTNKSKHRDPSTLVWAYTPVEDPAVYANIFKPFTDHLEKCVGKKTVYYPVQSNAAEIEAMRSGGQHGWSSAICGQGCGNIGTWLQPAGYRQVRQFLSKT
jgi:ABC-type phosphate/phosphonate transport system substrate-binding protein